ncbi:AAA family ATPase protein [Rutstroemia sp. NJR-2017a BVV2]|nr:AAA family ATPase protein [Rutstroemia sp. NJR-2017a BVV2]
MVCTSKDCNMDTDGEKENEKRSDNEKRSNSDRKVESAITTLTVTAQRAVEDKLAQLEKRFAELEIKYLGLKEKSEIKDIIPTSGSEQKEITHDNIVQADTDIPAGAEKTSSGEGRVNIVNSKVDEDGERRDHPSSLKQKSDASLKDGYAAILRRNLSLENGELEIIDPALRALLKKILPHYPGHYFVGENVEMYSPYEPFVLNWDMLHEEAKRETENEDKQARLDLKDLLKAIESGSGDKKLDSYFKVRDTLVKQKSITFESLWTIFPPGTIIYGKIFLNQDQIFIVDDNERPWPREGTRRSRTPDRWNLNCWTYDFTGKDFQRRRVVLSFDSFDGPKPIESLPFYPLSAIELKRRREIETRLWDRGKRFRTFCISGKDNRMYQYTGAAILDKRGFGIQSSHESDDDSDDKDSSSVRRPWNIDNSNVMVDFESYFRYGLAVAKIGDTPVSDNFYECNCQHCASNVALKMLFKPGYDNMTGKDSEEWEELQTMLCPPRVLGYILKDKQWAQLAVSDLKIIEDEDPNVVLKQLHLSGFGKESGDKKKDLLLGLVQHHGIVGTELEDLVAEKGKGLVFLLYGAPGVGKTSTDRTAEDTAQMIARAARKPLFSIGVADVGTDALQVESKLQTIFNLATTWRAILLIAYRPTLAMRQMSFFKVGAKINLVHRRKGVLSYLIAQFDVAVQSRVHIALKYERLNEDQTLKIFMGFIEQYAGQGHIDTNDFDRIKKYGQEDLYTSEFDGRQIRNLVACAMGYARSKKPKEKLNVEHIRDVVRFVQSFQKDLAGQMQRWNDAQKNAGLPRPS